MTKATENSEVLNVLFTSVFTLRTPTAPALLKESAGVRTCHSRGSSQEKHLIQLDATPQNQVRCQES